MRDLFESWYGQACMIANQVFSDPHVDSSLLNNLERSSCWHRGEIGPWSSPRRIVKACKLEALSTLPQALNFESCPDARAIWVLVRVRLHITKLSLWLIFPTSFRCTSIPLRFSGWHLKRRSSHGLPRCHLLMAILPFDMYKRPWDSSRRASYQECS